MPGRPNKAYFPKDDFKIDLEAGTCTCPAGQVTHLLRRLKVRGDGHGGSQQPRGFVFDAKVCSAYILRPRCIATKKGKGRTVSLHPQEALIQQARAFQKSDAFAKYKKRRQASIHRIARLVQLGIRQARYFGRVKTLFQGLLTATVANLTLVATCPGMMRGQSRKMASPYAVASLQRVLSTAKTLLIRLGRVLTSMKVSHPFQRRPVIWTRGYRPGF